MMIARRWREEAEAVIGLEGRETCTLRCSGKVRPSRAGVNVLAAARAYRARYASAPAIARKYKRLRAAKDTAWICGSQKGRVSSRRSRPAIWAQAATGVLNSPIPAWKDKRKAPNPGGGVGRKKRVMRIVPGGKPALRSDVFRLDGGHYR